MSEITAATATIATSTTTSTSTTTAIVTATKMLWWPFVDFPSFL